MRLTRRPISRFTIDVTWYARGENRVDFVFHRRTAVSAAEMEQQRQDGVRDPSRYTNLVVGATSCDPTTMAEVQDIAYAWLEEHEGADQGRDSFVFQNWASPDRELVEGRLGRR